MANETSKTAGSLWRVNYTHVNSKGEIRGGAIVVEATDAVLATQVAESRLKSFGVNHYRITNAKSY